MTLHTIDRPRNKKSTADLGGRGDELKLLPMTEAETAENVRLATAYVSRQPDAELLLEILGLTPYVSAKHRKTPKGPLVHGKRSTYVNYQCDCEPCVKANSDYFLERRANAVKAAA